MAINQADVEFALYVLNQAIYSHKALSVQDCTLIKSFIEALLEYQQRPSENVKSREWRAAVYRKLLEDPAALNQFTEQAIQKFGPENLAQMVAPQLQQIILARKIEEMDVSELADYLKSTGRWTDVLEYAMEHHEEWIEDQLNLSDRINNAYDTGYAAGKDEAKTSYEDGYESGYEDGQQSVIEESP